MNKIDFSTPKVMGILNITPDSFFDGNRYLSEKTVLQRVENMVNEGADIIDIGAFSSRPGADFVSYPEERKRLMPHLKKIVKEFPGIHISIDTYRHEIALEAVEKGARIINDISGGDLDEKMFETISKLPVSYVLMHMQGTPQNMQQNPDYQDVVSDIKQIFEQKINRLNQLGFKDTILDPGFGFGKSLEHNYTILGRFHEFLSFDLPVLAGISRKSMLFKLLQGQPADMLNATTVANTIALMHGAKILRVHDVKEAVEAVKIVEMTKSNS